MTVNLKLFRRHGVWHISQHKIPDWSTDDEQSIHLHEESGRKILQDNFVTLSECSKIWGLEFTKASIGKGEIALGLCHQIAKNCKKNRDIEHNFRSPKSKVPLRSIVLNLQAVGEKVLWGPVWKIFDRLQFLLAALIAFLIWFYSMARLLGRGINNIPSSSIMLAVHGEWSNRTRHVLQLLNECSLETPVIVLGRPKIHQKKLKILWEKQLGFKADNLILPFDFISSILSIPKALPLIIKGSRIIPTLKYKPDFTDQISMIYRVLLGTTSYIWWRQIKQKCKLVIYGHTGLADTTMLEFSQQTTGISTIHAVHGIPTGLNFSGYSTYAHFQCRHDAEIYKKLGTYGKCLAPEMEKPSCIRGSNGVLLLSNLIHPMNLTFQEFGESDEIYLINNLANAIDQLDIKRAEVTWKPHPAFEGASRNIKKHVFATVKEAGFNIWDNEWKISKANNFKYVFSTPSTIALDLIKLGMLTVIIDNNMMTPDNVLNCFPISTSNPSDLVAAINSLKDNEEYKNIFSKTWLKVGVARPISLACIKELNQTNDLPVNDN